MTYCRSSSLLPYQLGFHHCSPVACQLTIRPAQPRDLNRLAEILADSFHPSQGLLSWLYPLFKLGIYEDLRSRLRSESSHYICLVASMPVTAAAGKGEEIVGTVEIALRSTFSWSTLDSQYPYISNLAVKNSYRRQGIARQLLLKCEQIAVEWGVREISLHVLENNGRARQLYCSGGYQLRRTESSLNSWLFKQPKRLLLVKSL